MKDKVYSIAKKELASFFSSPVAFIFLGAFLIVNLFLFFWVEKFFSRNVADLRPLFDWMPVLLIFLSSALTMRMWSEEHRMGTLEFLMTLPVSTSRLVIGKFLACLCLVSIALVLTFPLPITVSYFADLDWGPIVGGYLASLLVAGAYIAMGLFVSSRSDNQVVSLIMSVFLCTIFYLLGTDVAMGLVGNKGSELLSLIGTGSRFESIAKGVLDFRDLYYYASLIGAFLALNVYSLEKIKWSVSRSSATANSGIFGPIVSLFSGAAHPNHKRWRTVTLLFVANFLVANFWIANVRVLRSDLTSGNVYTISDATHTIISQVQEPLLIRGYFSAKTHPLLAPLVPRLRDLIAEYELSGKGKIRAEFIDPRDEPELEEEANQKFNIKAVPFQVADRYQAGLVNSYFNILIKYGDQFEVLGFQDLIEVKVKGETELDIRLRNPEYDITRSIKKVLYGFQNLENLFASIKTPLKFIGFISSPDRLPEGLKKLEKELKEVVEELKTESGGKLQSEYADPQAGDGALATKLKDEFGFQPMIASLFDTNQFYFYMVLQGGDKLIQIALPEDMSKESVKQGLESALKRFSVGFTRTVGVYSPEKPPREPWQQRMNMGDTGKDFNLVKRTLEQTYEINEVDLKNGLVPEQVDLLMLLSPENLDEKQLFAIDQFLMKGGTVVLSSSAFKVTRDQRSLSASKNISGLEAMLKTYGVTIDEKFVLDTQSERYPVPMNRSAGGFMVQQIEMIKYPYFIDIRGKGMPQEGSLTSGLTQITMNWASPLVLDAEKNKDRVVTELLKSSPQSWLSSSVVITPEVGKGLAFPKGDEQKSYLLAASIEGKFESFFKDKKSPLLSKEEKKPEDEKKDEKAGEKKDDAAKDEKKDDGKVTGLIERSPASARLIVIGSSDFAADQTLALQLRPEAHRAPMQLIENTVDWSLEDRALLGIRGRGQFSRTLLPLEPKEQVRWEYTNYFLAFLGLLLVFGIYRGLRTLALTNRELILGSNK